MIRISHPLPLITFIFFVTTGLLLINQYGDYPIVRNSLIYAATIQGINDTSLWQASEFAQNKPLGFAIFSLPFSYLWGENLGLKISSWLATLAFGLVSILFIKLLANLYNTFETNGPKTNHSDRIDIKNNPVAIAVLLSLLNPLVFYQFISAYPDTLFAALFLAALISFFYLLRANGNIIYSPLSMALILAAVWVKHHGLILIPTLLLMAIYLRKDLLIQWQQQSKRVKFSILLFLLLIAILNDAHQGEIALFNMAQNQSNFLGGNDRLAIIWNNSNNFLLFCFLSFNLLTPLLFWGIFKKTSYGLVLPLLLLFILPILYYRGAQYNIRYFIPIIPLLAWLIALQMRTWSIFLRRISISLFILSSLLVSTYYHHLGFKQWSQQYISLPNIDNLRLLTEQVPEREHLADIRQYAQQYQNNLIYFSDYYEQGIFGVWQKAGLLPPELNIYYFMNWQPEKLDQLNIQSALIYEYVGVGQPINPMPKLTDYSQNMKKIGSHLYLWDRRHRL